MASNTLVLTLTHEDEQAPNTERFSLQHDMALRELASYLEALAAGHRVGSYSVVTNGGGAVSASATVTFSSASGTTSTLINGVTFQTTTGTDAERGVALEALINDSANALVAGVVTASANDAGVVTITADTAGPSGNWVTLSCSGTGITASAARLSGGTAATSTFSVEV